jgi:drug/metabolite transporter (DMT)-like permease
MRKASAEGVSLETVAQRHHWPPTIWHMIASGSGDRLSHPPRVRRGIAWAVSAVFFFTAMVGLVKWLTESFSIWQIAFCRALFAMLTTLPLLLAESGPRGLSTSRPQAFILRGLVGVAGLFGCYYGVSLMPIADWVAITFTVPLFVAALSAPMLGEHVGVGRWAAIIAGFLGVLIIHPPLGGTSLWALAVGLFGNGMIGVSIILIRRLSRTERTTTIVFYYMLALTVGTGVTAPIDWRWPGLIDGAALVAVGVIAGIAHMLLTVAYRMAPAAVIAPFDYTGIIWGLLLAYAVWGDRPGPSFYLGATIIIGSGLYVLMRETREPIGARSP